MIIEKARELGIALSQTPEFQNMLQTQKQLEADAEISRIMGEFRHAKESIMDMMSDADADAELMRAENGRMEEMRDHLFSSPVFVAAIEAQGEFQKVMDMVNREIGACIGVPMGEEDDDDCGSCGGNCGGCSGCKH